MNHAKVQHRIEEREALKREYELKVLQEKQEKMKNMTEQEIQRMQVLEKFKKKQMIKLQGNNQD